MKKIVLLNAGLFFFAAVNAQQTQKITVNHPITADRKLDSVRQFIMGKDTSAKKLPTKKPQKKAAKKSAKMTKAKRDD